MVFILYNPYANNGNGTEGVAQVQRKLIEREPELVDLTSIQPKTFLETLTKDDSVILCGGDGTINRLVNDLEGQCPEVPIHVWCFGTGNDFIRDVSEDHTPAWESSVLLNTYMKNIPYADIDGKRRWFMNGCCGGVDALVCAKMNEQRGKKPSYVLNAIESFFKDYKPTSARITADGETQELDRVWIAGAMNGRYQGGGMLFAPGQYRTSERLSLFAWHGTSALGILLAFPRISNGSHTKLKEHCVLRPARTIEIEYADPVYVQLDGETVPNVTKLTISK